MALRAARGSEMTVNTATSEPGVEPDANGEFTIDRCSSCATRIALRSPTPDSPASAWLCRRCGSVYFARCQEKDGKPFSAGTRLVSYYEVMKAINVHIEGKSSPIPQKDVQRLVQCLAARQYNGREARRQKRFPVAAPVTVVPLGADFRVAGQPARVMTINVSGGGAAIVHARRIVEPYLAIDFSASGVELLPAVLQVTRVRTLASAFEVAGRFQSRILH
jgi:predicted RNA-binding Zn-ribbon protein involved in translation (DUF1610 family)